MTDILERLRAINPDHGQLVLLRDGAIQWAVFNRPHARNALTWAMYEQLVEVCEEVNADSSIRAMVLSGAGGAFAAGTDIAQFRAFNAPQDAIDYEARGSAVMDVLESVRVPVIAALAGPCTGAGAVIAACCDLRLAAPSVRYGVPIARTLGNCLSLRACARLVGALGLGLVKDMLLTARLLEAPELLQRGFIRSVVPADGDLWPAASILAAEVAANAPLTLRVSKASLRLIRDRLVPEGPDDDLILTCYLSHDFHEGVDAFLAKRPPSWQGE